MFAVACLLLVLSYTVMADPGISNVNFFSDANCTLPFDGTPYNIHDNREQWYSVDVSNVLTYKKAQSQTYPSCVVSPYTGVASAQFKCVQGTDQDGTSQAQLYIREWWNQTDCLANQSNTTSSFLGGSNVGFCVPGILWSSTMTGFPAGTFAQFTCENSAASLPFPMIVPAIVPALLAFVMFIFM